MTRGHWVLFGIGMFAWAVLVVVWMTGPDICDQPHARDSSHCQGRK